MVFELIRTERTDGQNQGVFSLSVFPSLLLMYDVDLSQAVAFECDSAHSVSSLSYESSVLSITTDYTEDLEGSSCNFTFTDGQNRTFYPVSYTHLTLPTKA